MSTEFSHIGPDERARMVDVSGKPPTCRTAIAAGFVRCSPELIAAIESRSVAKGNLLETARLAGIMAAKRTSDWIPLCHPLPLEYVDVELTLSTNGITLRAKAVTTARTGIEMEALTAVAAAALTVIDMGKAIDKAMEIANIRLLYKEGGRSGVYLREEDPTK